MISQILLLFSFGILGLFLGTQLAEAYLLVPYWKSMSADDFFNLHKTYGKKIHRFFAPLTIAATFIPLATTIFNFLNQIGNTILLFLMAFSIISFFSTYFLYFKKANKSFADRSLSDKDLPFELEKWGNWHWTRIYFEIAAFICSLLLLLTI